MLGRVAYLVAKPCAQLAIALTRWTLRIRPLRRSDVPQTCIRLAIFVEAGSKQHAVLGRLTEGLAPGTCRTILTRPPENRDRFPALATWRRGAAIARSLRGEGMDALVASTANPAESIAVFIASRLLGCRFGLYLLERPWRPKPDAAARILRVVDHFGFLLVPNESMRSYYQQRHKRQSALSPPAAVRRPSGRPGVRTHERNPSFRIVLKGTVDSSNCDIFAAIANAVPAACGGETRLSFHTSQPAGEFASMPALAPRAAIYAGLSTSALEEIEPDADLFLIALPLHVEDRDFANSAGTAELAESLGSGKPILAICPEESYLGQYLTTNESGLALHDAERSSVARAIDLLIVNHESSARFASNALHRASVDFDPRMAQGNFVDALRLVNLPSHLRIAPPASGPGKLRIAMLSAYDILGIQANGFLLHKYFHKQGHDSRMLVHVKMSMDKAVYEIGTPLQYRVNRLASLAEKALSTRAMLSTLGRGVSTHPKMADADIVNVQLIHGAQFYSLLGLPHLTRVKRVVLSIHDMFLQTGHCVQAIECERWRTGCGACPDLLRPFRFLNDTTALNWKLKKSIFDRCRLDLVVASSWMKGRVAQSPILSRFPVHHIPFGIDESIFRLTDKYAARQRLGIPADAHVIAFRSQPGADHMYKGTRFVEAALAKYAPSRPTCLVTLEGTGGLESIRNKYRFVELGWINDQERIADALNASDLFLMPSTAESFGLMAVESMACGAPVIAFEGTALPETIDAPRSGVAVPFGDSDALARAIEECLGNPVRLDALRENGLRHVADNHSFSTYGDRHLELFDRLAGGR